MHLNPFDEEKILLRFGVLSDCHLGMEPSEDDKKLQKLLRTFLHMAGSATFSGHTHFPVADERSIWQGGYTSINTGSSSYLLSAAGGADAGGGAVCASVYGSAPSEYTLSGACDGL